MKTARALLLVGVVGAASIGAGLYMWNSATSAAGGGAVTSEEPRAQARLVSDFSGFAGSEINARSLVAGLRHGNEIALVPLAAGGQSGTVTRFTPPTRPMDYSSIRVALVLAKEQLALLGITRPTPTQIRAVLVGGGIAGRVGDRASTPFLLPGVLQMRAGGMSWARIADTMGVKLAQPLNGAPAADAAVPMDSARVAAAGGPHGAVPAAAAKADAPALRPASPTKATPISSASITTSTAGGPTTRAEIRRESPAQIATREPAQKPRRSQVRVVIAADGAAKKETTTLRAPDSAQAEAVRAVTAPTSAAARPVEPASSAIDQLVE
ncbi:MAG TPA: hypothetical protein VH881_14415 [Burkholderiales bacterium]